MKKFIAFLLVPVLLLTGGCALGGVPAFKVCPKFSAEIYFGKEKFDVDSDFTSARPVVTVNNEKNAFRSVYTFYDESVKIKYDDIECKVETKDLPKGNIPLIIYRIYNSLSNKESVVWKYDKALENWDFSGKCGSLRFSGSCDEDGKILKFTVPEVQISATIKKFG